MNTVVVVFELPSYMTVGVWRDLSVALAFLRDHNMTDAAEWQEHDTDWYETPKGDYKAEIHELLSA